MPKDKENGPKSISDIKLINARRVYLKITERLLNQAFLPVKSLEVSSRCMSSCAPLFQTKIVINCRIIPRRKEGAFAPSCNISNTTKPLRSIRFLLPHMFVLQVLDCI